MQPLDLLTEQLWAPALSSDVRVAIDPPPHPAWLDAEAYRVIPSLRSARLLVPDGERQAALGALLNYRGLRPRRENALRATLGAAARTGMLARMPRLAVQVRADGAAAADLPLRSLATALGRNRVWASIGVRTGANRKATLQLVDDRGQPVGYAKFGWSPLTDEYVATEREALLAIGGTSTAMRAPRVLSAFTYHGHPVVVTEPLPGDVRGCHESGAAPTPEEMFSLCPVHRVAPAACSQHLATLTARLALLARSPVTSAPAAAAQRLAARVCAIETPVPLTSRWHGDLTAWNCARDTSGNLWAWDWESSDVDAVAGQDALHWEFSARRLATGSVRDTALAEALDAVRRHLVAAGVTRETHALVAAVYCLTVVDRAAALADRNGGWSRVWIQPEALLHLVATADRMLSTPV